MLCTYFAKSINTYLSLSLCLNGYLNLQMQNAVQIHLQPLLISERDNIRLCLNWGFFSPQWKLRPVLL